MNRLPSYILLIVTILASCSGKQPQSNSSKFFKLITNKDWSVKLGEYSTAVNFMRDTLNLTLERVALDSIISESKKDTISSKYGIHYLLAVLKFDTNGVLKYNLDVKGLGLCGNGLMDLKEGKWWLDNDKLYIDVKGSIFPNDDFHYKIEYLVTEIDSNKVNLVRIRVIFQKGAN